MLQRARQAICLKKIFDELQFIQEKTIVIYCDNNYTIKLSQNSFLHYLSKHTDVKYHYLRELISEKTIELIYHNNED